MWIKLHYTEEDKEIFVRSESITNIRPTCIGTIVSFIGSNDNAVTVEETPRDIFILMQANVAEFEDGRLKLTRNKE